MATLFLALVHSIAGIIIFLLPIIIVSNNSLPLRFIWVSIGGGLIGIGGILLAFLKAGNPILNQNLIYKLLPGILLLMTAAFNWGLTVIWFFVWLRAAIEAQTTGVKATIISMVYPIRSHLVAAQGGINAALNNGTEAAADSWEKHAFDTVKGSDYLADQNAVAILTKEVIPAVYELQAWGEPFSRLPTGRIAQRPFGGAAFPRNCYAEDRTGHNLLYTLYQ